MMVIPIDPKEMQTNNLRILRLKKANFKECLTNSFQILGFVFICILYLQNISIVRFILRAVTHFLIVKPFPEGFVVVDGQRKRIVRSLFITMLLINGICTFLDLLVGVPSQSMEIGLSDNGGNYLFGGISVQLIGEHKPSSRLSFFYLNVVIFAIQYCLIYISTLLDINQVIRENEASITQFEVDGYSGRTKISSMNPCEVYREIMNFSYTNEIQVDPENSNGTGNENATERTYNDYLENRLAPGNINLSTLMNSV